MDKAVEVSSALKDVKEAINWLHIHYEDDITSRSRTPDSVGLAVETALQRLKKTEVRLAALLVELEKGR